MSASEREIAAHRGEHLRRSLREWAADQREREGWNDNDRSAYHYRAMVLEGALAELAGMDSALAQARRDGMEAAAKIADEHGERNRNVIANARAQGPINALEAPAYDGAICCAKDIASAIRRRAEEGEK